MKNLIAFVLGLCCAVVLLASPQQTFQKLASVNSCWLEQKGDLHLPKFQPQTETEWIQLHLKLVEQNLRAKNVSQLSPSQKQNRLTALNHLNAYWQQAVFPQNEDYGFRLPIFIDKQDNFCAVGYLLKATGYENVSRKIAAETNLAYVREMNYPELTQWANQFGFSVDELAWIQPTYPPQSTFKAVGNGTDGDVLDIAVDEANNCFYVAGTFTHADSTIVVNNIAKVSEQNGVYTWSAMGAGTNGKVNAVAVFDGKVFIGGTFTQAGNTNINYAAYWDGTQWKTAASGLFGGLNAFAIHNGALFAAGDCYTCAAFFENGFVYKWNGTSWELQGAVTGKINRLKSLKSELYAVGKFRIDGMNACYRNIVRWTVDSLVRVGNNCLINEVYDITLYRDTLLTSCKFYDEGNITGIQFFDGTQWLQYMGPTQFVTEGIDGKSVRAITSRNNVLVLGGEFYNTAIIGTMANNFLAFDPVAGDENLGNFDKPINRFAFYKNKMILGGEFETHNFSTKLNHIAIKDNLPIVNAPTGISEAKTVIAKIYPNPVQRNSTLKIEIDEILQQLIITDVSGRVVHSGNESNIVLNNFSAGVYMLNGKTNSGEMFAAKLMVE